MWFQWGEQRDYFSQTWNCSVVFGVLFVLFNLFGQLGGVAMVLARQKVEIAVAILGSVVVVQASITRSQIILLENTAAGGGRVRMRSIFMCSSLVFGNK